MLKFCSRNNGPKTANICARLPRQIWPSTGLILQSTVLFSPSWSQPEVASSPFSFGSSKSCFFSANRRAMEQVTCLRHQFAFSGGLQEPTRCLFGDHLRFGWTSITVNTFLHGSVPFVHLWSIYFDFEAQWMLQTIKGDSRRRLVNSGYAPCTLLLNYLPVATTQAENFDIRLKINIHWLSQTQFCKLICRNLIASRRTYSVRRNSCIMGFLSTMPSNQQIRLPYLPIAI